MEFEVVKPQKDNRILIKKIIGFFLCALVFHHDWNFGISQNFKTGKIKYHKRCDICNVGFKQS